jgi:hypothetical protein
MRTADRTMAPCLLATAALICVISVSACHDQPLTTDIPAPDAVETAAAAAATTTAAVRREELAVGVAPRPEHISEDEVRDALARVDPHAGYGVADFQTLLRLFPSARRHVAFQYLTAKALDIADERPGRSSAQFLRRLVLAQSAAEFLPGLVPPFTASAECMVAFDDPQSLAALPDAAGDTRAWGSYAQFCAGTSVVRVEPMQYGHVHLNFENPLIGCINLEEGVFGYGEPGDLDCPPIDPLAEPRYLTAHLPDQVIKIWRTPGPLLVPLTFSVRSIANVGGEPITVRFKTEAGFWNQFASLGGYTLWDLSDWVTDVVEVHITHAATDPQCGDDWIAQSPGDGCPTLGGVFSVDDIAIDP